MSSVESLTIEAAAVPGWRARVQPKRLIRGLSVIALGGWVRS